MPRKEKTADESVEELRKVIDDYATKLSFDAQYEDVLVKRKKEQCLELTEILLENPLSKKQLTAEQKLFECLSKIEVFKKENDGLMKHRKEDSAKAENVLRGFGAFLASCTLILAPYVAYKAHSGTLFKQTKGEQMLDKSKKIIKRHEQKK